MLDCDRTGHSGPVTDKPELHPDSSADTGRLKERNRVFARRTVAQVVIEEWVIRPEFRFLRE